MRKPMICAAALALWTVPALADWAPTRWGMTPEQVIAVVPNAQTMPHKDEQNLRRLHLLVEAPGAVGDFPVNARYYFAPGQRTLDLVNLTVTDRTRCAAFRDWLTGRHGAGARNDDTGNRDGTSYETTTIEWSGAQPDRLTYTDLRFGERFGICKLIVQKR
jgi:hypothetical protein